MALAVPNDSPSIGTRLSRSMSEQRTGVANGVLVLHQGSFVNETPQPIPRRIRSNAEFSGNLPRGPWDHADLLHVCPGSAQQRFDKSAVGICNRRLCLPDRRRFRRDTAMPRCNNVVSAGQLLQDTVVDKLCQPSLCHRLGHSQLKGNVLHATRLSADAANIRRYVAEEQSGIVRRLR